MTQLTLTKEERAAVVHWLNGAGGDNDYFIKRAGSNTHVQRQTINIKGGKWKVRIAFEADTGYPLAMGSPIQSAASGRHEEKPGQATIPASHKQAKMTNYMIQAKAPFPGKGILTPIKPSAFDFLLVDDPAPAPPDLTLKQGVTIDTLHGKLHLLDGDEYTSSFVKEYNLEHEVPAQTNYVLVPLMNKMVYKLMLQADAW